MRMIKMEYAHKVDPFADHEVDLLGDHELDLLGDHQVDLFADHRMDLFGRSVTMKYDEAIGAFSESIKLRPDFADSYRGRAWSYIMKKKYKKAQRDLDESLHLCPDFPIAYLLKGLIYSKTGQFEKSIKNYDKAIKFNPDLAAAYSGKGVVLIQLKNYDKAIVILRKALTLNPKKEDKIAILTNMGSCFTKQKKFERSLKIYNRILDLEPNYIIAHYNKGIIFEHLKKYDDAVKSYKEFLQIIKKADEYELKSMKEDLFGSGEQFLKDKIKYAEMKIKLYESKRVNQELNK